MLRTFHVVRRLVFLFAVLLAVVSSRAVELSLFQTFTNINMAATGLGGLRYVGAGTMVVTNIPAGAAVKKALLYWHGPSNDLNGSAPVSITVNGAVYSGASIGFSDGNCWDQVGLFNSRACRADVTRAITGNGQYALSNFLPLGENVNGASLLVFYDDGNPSNDRNYIVYEGNDSNVGSKWDALGWNLNISSFNYLRASGPARIQLHVSDGQSPAEAAVLINNNTTNPLLPLGFNFQGNTVPIIPNVVASITTTNSNGTLTVNEVGGLWDIRTFDISSYLTDGVNAISLTSSSRTADCLGLIVAVLDLPTGSASQPCSPSNHPPTVQCTNPSFTIEANSQSGHAVANVSAVFSDPDGDALRVTWKIDNVIVAFHDYPATAPNTPQTNLVTLSLAPAHGHSYAIEADVTDFCAPVQVCQFSIVVVDAVPPTIICPPANTQVQVHGRTFPMPDLRPLLQLGDNVTPVPQLVVTQTPAVGTPMTLGVTTVKFTAEDQALNISSCQSTFLLVDPTLPLNPVARDDSFRTAVNTPLIILQSALLSNDSDPLGNPLTITSVTSPAHGTLVDNHNGSYTYTPAADFHGTDSFTYTISNPLGGTATATVTISVTYDPIAVDDSVTLNEDIPVAINVLANDSSPNGGTLQVVSVTAPTFGTTSGPGNPIVYTPAASFLGTDTFTYTITDGFGGFAKAIVTVTIKPCDLYPIALSVQNVANVPVGTVIADILNGTEPGNFGWLTWAGSSSTPTLVTSLTIPGNSDTYINPYNSADHIVSIGDWVHGSTGVSNGSKVRAALDALEQIDITVPVWDQTKESGNNTLYHVVNFARVRILNYQLPEENRITARFLGFALCGDAPPPSPPPITLLKGDDDEHSKASEKNSSDDDSKSKTARKE